MPDAAAAPPLLSPSLAPPLPDFTGLVPSSPVARRSVPVDTEGGRYTIEIGPGLLDDPASFAGLPKVDAVVVVSNTTVAPLWLPSLDKGLRGAWPQARHLQLELPDGEAHKEWPTLQRIFDFLLEQGCGRRTLLVALGGGVIGDMVGFAAGCFMRGVPFVQVPTTLLAQVDSSVGGKTAINHPLGKNMIGLFNQPVRVLCDLDTLGTLPEREWVAGLAEVIKYGPIADAAFFEWLEQHLDLLKAREPQAVAATVARCCALKAAVVGADEREAGLREILNFGHTFGHAIEAGLGFGTWLHGEAVGCGMVMAADLSHQQAGLPAADAQRIAALVARAGLPVAGPGLSQPSYWASMQHDKKALGGAVRFVLVPALGQARTQPCTEAEVAAVLARHGAT